MDDALIVLRALQFAATVSAAGVVFFRAFVAEPAFRATAEGAVEMAAVPMLRSQFAMILWTSLGFVIATSLGWLAVETAQMNDVSLSALSGSAAWTVLSDTNFGSVWLARLLIMALFAAAWLREARQPIELPRSNALSIALAAALSGSLAFAGHAAAGEGTEGSVHLVSDILHLLGAAAWLGALLPLAALLGAAWRKGEPGLAMARTATLRFSTLGIASVGALLATGIINSWVLVGSVSALFETDYGRLLLLKIALFLAMLSIAAINRTRLTPRLAQMNDVSVARGAMRQLRINCMIETALGAIILIVVGALGTLPPGAHEDAAGGDELAAIRCGNSASVSRSAADYLLHPSFEARETRSFHARLATQMERWCLAPVHTPLHGTLLAASKAAD